MGVFKKIENKLVETLHYIPVGTEIFPSCFPGRNVVCIQAGASKHNVTLCLLW